MKKEKNYKIKTKIVIVFLLAALLCIFGISSCGGGIELSPNIDFNDKDYNDNGNTNTNSNNPTNSVTPTPEPEPTPTPSFPEDSYRNIEYHEGTGRNYTSKKVRVSYKDTATLSQIWTNMITKFLVRGYYAEFDFKPNGDLYWENKLLKKFEGGTIIMYRNGKLWTGGYDTTYGIGGVYTYAISRDDANNLGNDTVKVLFNKNTKYDNGGKKGRIEVLVLNYGFFWDGYTAGGMNIWYNNLLIVDNSNWNLIFGFQSYNRRTDDYLGRYFGDKTPEENMKALENTWNYWK